MSKKRAALKYGTAGVATALYAAAAASAIQEQKSDALPTPTSPKKVVIIAATMSLLTWIAALA